MTSYKMSQSKDQGQGAYKDAFFVADLPTWLLYVLGKVMWKTKKTWFVFLSLSIFFSNDPRELSARDVVKESYTKNFPFFKV